MQAIVYTKYGPPDVLKLADVEKPAPKDNEVLVKVRAVAANAADWRLMRADPFLARFYSGLLKPKYNILGSDIAGWVEAVGKNVERFKQGDEVFGGLAECGWGGFAEYACAHENALVDKPANISFEEAASVPMAGVTALIGLRDAGKIKPRQKVLINGAAGGVGTFAVQIAKWFGAEVTAVCGAGNLAMARSLGADHVIDYTQEDFTKSGRRYDLILAVNGYHSIFEYRHALSAGGIYVMVGGSPAQLFQALLLGPFISMAGTKKMGSLTVRTSQKDLAFLGELLKAGKVSPVIDRCYTLKEVPEAIRYLEGGHAKGKLVITVEQ
ncbi:MAG: NAD(P)-dependent alcohol dehydrogenase [Nitrospinae bacterium]|nr:NAD(P)-dependent alcohol dehydrogenase [Nitrospinota bacterium]